RDRADKDRPGADLPPSPDVQPGSDDPRPTHRGPEPLVGPRQRGLDGPDPVGSGDRPAQGRDVPRGDGHLADLDLRVLAFRGPRIEAQRTTAPLLPRTP